MIWEKGTDEQTNKNQVEQLGSQLRIVSEVKTIKDALDLGNNINIQLMRAVNKKYHG